MDEELKAYLDGMEGRLMSKMSLLVEGLHTAINGIREDLTTLGGANDHTRMLNDNTRDEVRSLTKLVADVQRVQLKHGTRLDDLDRRLSRKLEGG
jgi:hypothetical protein